MFAGGSDNPKSKPRGLDTLVLIGGGLLEEKMIEEVAEVWDEDGRYSKAGLCGDFDDNDELENPRSVSNELASID